jgi:hypothetical protein
MDPGSLGAGKIVLLLLMPLVLCVFSPESLGQARTERASAAVIVDVMNYHFTMGHKIPSVFLKVLSDGTVECGSLRATGPEANVVKKKLLTPEELREVTEAIDRSKLLHTEARYELTHPVIDSWMEWDITIPRAEGVQDITIAAFASTPLRDGPYPIAVVRLGCTISRLRDEVYGDEPAYRRNECKNVSMR